MARHKFTNRKARIEKKFSKSAMILLIQLRPRSINRKDFSPNMAISKDGMGRSITMNGISGILLITGLASAIATMPFSFFMTT